MKDLVKNCVVWTAVVTPFSATGDGVDFLSFERCLRLQEANGNGVVIMGSTGESLSLSFEERREILDFTCSLKLTVPVLTGVPSHNLQDALEWMSFCQGHSIDGFLMTAPIYTKPGVEGQTQWFQALMNQTEKPVMLYNIPGRAYGELHAGTVRHLKDHPCFWAVKDAGGTIDSVVAYQEAAPNVAVFCGDDALMPAMAAEGAVGLVSVASNAWPAATQRYVRHALSGGRFPDKIWWRAVEALFAASNPIPIKALLHAIGLISHDTVRLPLSQKDFQGLKVLQGVHAQMESWSPKDQA